MDVKDILRLPQISFPVQEKNSQSQRKPDAISQEVYALTGGLTPLIPAVDLSLLNKRPPTNQKAIWQWLPFKNSARKDDLQLYHWVQALNGVPPTEDYSFAKYNKSVDITRYTDEEYEKYLANPKWTKEETDQLFELCERFNLRFIVIADRFPSSRSVEELKDRYYSVSRAILIARSPSSGDVAGHPLVKEPYNVSHEMEQKRAMSLVLSQTRQQERRDEEVLAEAKRIAELRLMTKIAEEAELVVTSNAGEDVTERLDPSETVSPSNMQLPPIVVPSTITADNASTVASLCMLHVYLRTYALEQMVQSASSSAGLRTIKRVDQTLQELGVNLKPRVPTKAVCAEHLELRNEILTLLNLQKQIVSLICFSCKIRRLKVPLFVMGHIVKQQEHQSVHIVVEIRIRHLFQITQVLEGKELVKGIKSARHLDIIQKFRHHRPNRKDRKNYRPRIVSSPGGNWNGCSGL